MTPLVVIPARNEATRIGAVVTGVRTHNLPVAVINDGSEDGTEEEARGAGAIVIRHRIPLGYGAALETGFHYALRCGFDTVVTMDGDGQHDPAVIPGLLAALRTDGGADVVLGSRELGRREGLPMADIPGMRRIGQVVLRRIATMMSGQEFTDPTTGCLALGPRALEFLTHGNYPHDYPDADVLVMLVRAGLRVREIPIAVVPRAGGASMHGGWKPLYYMFKMSISLLLTPLRREEGAYHS